MSPYYTDLKNIIHPLTAITSFVRTSSASWEESTFIENNFLPLSGGTLTGKVGIGTDNNNNALTVMGTISSTGGSFFSDSLTVKNGLYSNFLLISGNSVSGPTESWISNHSSTGSIPPTLIFEKSRSFTVPQNNDVLGKIAFYGRNSYSYSTTIQTEVDGNAETNVPGRITFYTAPTGFGGQQLRMTIKNDGKVGIGTNIPNENLTVVGNISATSNGYFTNLYGNFPNGFTAGNEVVLPSRVEFDGGIFYSNGAIFDNELGFIDGNSNVLAIKRMDNDAPTWEFGGGYPGTATLRVSSDSNVQTRFDINSLLVVLPNLPTLSAGLPVGALWNDAGAVKIIT